MVGGLTQALLRQHPVVQLLWLQTQLPPTHCWPAPHEAPVPHPQAPVAAHVSFKNVSQATHAPPSMPQVATARALQVAPAQQPPGQLVPSHTHCPPLHRWPLAHAPPVAPHTHAPPAEQRSVFVASHAAHEVPPSPQVGKLGATHVFPMQQPLGQLAGVHAHTPPSQCCPVAH